MEVARAMSASSVVVDKYFDELKTVIQDYGFDEYPHLTTILPRWNVVVRIHHTLWQQASRTQWLFWVWECHWCSNTAILHFAGKRIMPVYHKKVTPLKNNSPGHFSILKADMVQNLTFELFQRGRNWKRSNTLTIETSWFRTWKCRNLEQPKTLSLIIN